MAENIQVIRIIKICTGRNLIGQISLLFVISINRSIKSIRDYRIIIYTFKVLEIYCQKENFKQFLFIYVTDINITLSKTRQQLSIRIKFVHTVLLRILFSTRVVVFNFIHNTLIKLHEQLFE